jgi:hypothetical protein
MYFYSAIKKKSTTGMAKNNLILWLEGKDYTNSAPATTTLVDHSNTVATTTCSNFAHTITSGSDLHGNIVFDGTDQLTTPYIPNNTNKATFEICMSSLAINNSATQFFMQSYVSWAFDPGSYGFFYDTANKIHIGIKMNNGAGGTHENVTADPIDLSATTQHTITAIIDATQAVSTNVTSLYIDGIKLNMINVQNSNYRNKTLDNRYIMIGPSAHIALRRYRHYNRILSVTEILQNNIYDINN